MNVGPKSATRWILRMVPKGRKGRADYFIDADTKDLLLEVVRFVRAPKPDEETAGRQSPVTK
jgi:hypothetical protein